MPPSTGYTGVNIKSILDWDKQNNRILVCFVCTKVFLLNCSAVYVELLKDHQSEYNSRLSLEVHIVLNIICAFNSCVGFGLHRLSLEVRLILDTSTDASRVDNNRPCKNCVFFASAKFL